MSLDTCFEIEEKNRITIIDKNIVSKLPEEEKEDAKTRAIDIINNYVGRDVDAISVLMYAAEKGRFKEYAEKLEKHYQESLQFVHPEARRVGQMPGSVRAEMFFLDCYKEMGIKPKQ
jgi:hypothetical protein